MAPVNDLRLKRTSDQIGAEILGVAKLSELEFDDDETLVLDLEAAPVSSSRTPTIIPPRVHEGDVYMLTKQHLRFKAGIVPMTDERVSLDEIMRAPSEPPDRDTTPMADTELDRDTLENARPIPLMHKPTSLAPMVFNVNEPPAGVARPTVPAVPRVHPGYAITLGALAVAAVGVLFMPAANARRAAEAPRAQLAAPQAPTTEVVASSVMDLPEVEVVGTIEHRTGVLTALVAAAMAPQKDQAVPVAPAEVAALATAELPAAAPPAEVELGPFDKAAASTALNAALSAAASCRKEGAPNFPFNITVTFATSGVVTTAVVNGPPFAGTPTGGCIAKTFRSARVNPFSGAAVSINKTYQLP